MRKKTKETIKEILIFQSLGGGDVAERRAQYLYPIWGGSRMIVDYIRQDDVGGGRVLKWKDSGSMIHVSAGLLGISKFIYGMNIDISEAGRYDLGVLATLKLCGASAYMYSSYLQVKYIYSKRSDEEMNALHERLDLDVDLIYVGGRKTIAGLVSSRVFFTLYDRYHSKYTPLYLDVIGTYI